MRLQPRAKRRTRNTFCVGVADIHFTLYLPPQRKGAPAGQDSSPDSLTPEEWCPSPSLRHRLCGDPDQPLNRLERAALEATQSSLTAGRRTPTAGLRRARLRPPWRSAPLRGNFLCSGSACCGGSQVSAPLTFYTFPHAFAVHTYRLYTYLFQIFFFFLQ